MDRRTFLSSTGAVALLGCAGARLAPSRFGRIAYRDQGRGPTALFLHGLPLSSHQWRGAIDRLASVRRCLAPDLMGLGETEIAEGQDVSPRAQVAMLLDLLDRLGIADVDLVASDSGGAIAQLLVAHHPARVRTLLLTNCDVHEDSPPPGLGWVIDAARAGTFADDNLVPQLADPAKKRSATGLEACCYQPGGLSDETLRVYLGPLVRSARRKRQLHAYCIALAENVLVPIEPLLLRSQVPLRVVWGTGDGLFSAASPDWLDRTFPRSLGVRRLEGAKLFFPEEQPDVIAEEARRLWRATPRG